MKRIDLRGWNIAVEKTRTEIKPPSGEQIVFEMGQKLRDHVVRELTGGIVLAGGDLPKL